jgi:general secretion pathway protein A
VYKSFFGLKKNPFNVNPDPRYLYLTPAMRQALDELTYGIQHRKGLMTLTGEVGTGKTTLVNHLLSWLEHQRARTAFIFNSHLDSKQLFDFILSDFEVPLTPATRDNPLLAFNDWLVARNKARELVVLIVDEAQGLPTHVLEDIRLLQNMETPDEKLLQIVLSGQPELEIKLKRPDLVQLQQRIALRCKTAPLTLPETYGYIEDRLNTAGAGGETVFLPEAVEAVYLYSRGIPRVINLLCENSLIAAYADHERPIPAGIVEEAARDLQFDEMRPVAPRLKAIDGTSSANDLHSLLARIEASAIHVDRADRGVSTARVSPFLVTAENAAARREQIAVTASIPAQSSTENGQARESSNVARKPAVLSPVPAAIQRIPNTSIGKRIGRYAETGAANLREVLRRMKKSDFHSIASSTRDGLQEAFRKVELKKRAISSANALRLGIIKGRAFVLVVAVPKTKIHASNAGKSARSWGAWTVNWWKQNLNDHRAANTFMVTAGILSVLYFAVRGINPLHSWQRSGLTGLGFVSALLVIMALSLVLTMFLAKRMKSLKYRSGMASSAMRWLKAPMHASHMRAFGTMAGKAQSHRRV